MCLYKSIYAHSLTAKAPCYVFSLDSFKWTHLAVHNHSQLYRSGRTQSEVRTVSTLVIIIYQHRDASCVTFMYSYSAMAQRDVHQWLTDSATRRTESVFVISDTFPLCWGYTLTQVKEYIRQMEPRKDMVTGGFGR